MFDEEGTVIPMNTQVGYFHAIIDGVDFVFIDHSCFHHVKDSIYAGELPDQSFRFQLLCRAALEAVRAITAPLRPLLPLAVPSCPLLGSTLIRTAPASADRARRLFLFKVTW